MLVLEDDPLTCGAFRLRIVAEQAMAGFGKVLVLRLGLVGWLVG
jgi:hypothetical protein